MNAKILLAAGYAALMWAAAWGLRIYAGRSNGTWVGSETVGFVRAIALVPLAVGDLVLLGAALAFRSFSAWLVLAPLFAAITWAGWRELGLLRTRP